MIRSLSLPVGVPVPHFETLDEARKHLNGNELLIVDLLNKYGRQKDSLVNARDFLSEVVDTEAGKVFKYDDKEFKGLGFPRLTKKDGDKTVPSETETEHLDRFASAVAAGKVTVPGFTPTGTDPAAKEESVWTFLQKVIEQHGPFPFDLNASTRVGKPKKPAVYAVTAATNIINNHNEAGWAKKFTQGYESPGFGFVDPITFSDFQQKPAKGATPEQVEAVRQSNINNLAFAIMAVEEFKRSKQTKAEYA